VAQSTLSQRQLMLAGENSKPAAAKPKRATRGSNAAKTSEKTPRKVERQKGE